LTYVFVKNIIFLFTW